MNLSLFIALAKAVVVIVILVIIFARLQRGLCEELRKVTDIAVVVILVCEDEPPLRAGQSIATSQGQSLQQISLTRYSATGMFYKA